MGSSASVNPFFNILCIHFPAAVALRRTPVSRLESTAWGKNCAGLPCENDNSVKNDLA